jgi:molybdopterin-guanine dinucleotide biosynthesis protein A
MNLAGVVLCGGRSTRMGQSKAWLPIAGELLLLRILRVLGEVLSPVVVVAAPGQDLPPLPPAVAVYRDPVEGRGPLQGLAVGLQALTGRAEAAMVVSCDVPLLQSAFVRRMIALLGEAAICVPQAEGRLHPLSGVYRVEVAPVAERLLAAGKLRVMDLFDEVPTRIVSAEELGSPLLASLRNVNTPADLAAVLNELHPTSPNA